MSYGREDDRYYRRELAGVRDRLDEVRELLAGVRDELRRDDPDRTVPAREALRRAAAEAQRAQDSLDVALVALPAPAAELVIAKREVRH